MGRRCSRCCAGYRNDFRCDDRAAIGIDRAQDHSPDLRGLDDAVDLDCCLGRRYRDLDFFFLAETGASVKHQVGVKRAGRTWADIHGDETVRGAGQHDVIAVGERAVVAERVLGGPVGVRVSGDLERVLGFDIIADRTFKDVGLVFGVVASDHAGLALAVAVYEGDDLADEVYL